MVQQTIPHWPMFVSYISGTWQIQECQHVEGGVCGSCLASLLRVFGLFVKSLLFSNNIRFGDQWVNVLRNMVGTFQSYSFRLSRGIQKVTGTHSTPRIFPLCSDVRFLASIVEANGQAG